MRITGGGHRQKQKEFNETRPSIVPAPGNVTHKDLSPAPYVMIFMALLQSADKIALAAERILLSIGPAGV